MPWLANNSMQQTTNKQPANNKPNHGTHLVQRALTRVRTPTLPASRITDGPANPRLMMCLSHSAAATAAGAHL